MKKTILCVALFSIAACSKKSDNNAASAAKPAEATPTTKAEAAKPAEAVKPAEAAKPADTAAKPAEAAAAKAGGKDDCYTQCLANGPDDSPMTKADWPKKSKTDKENDCSAACADEGMPVENEK